MDFDFSDLVGPFSALAAFVSAAIAYQANRNVAKSDRVRQVREVSLLANKVVAATIHIDDLSNELKMGYQTLFTFAGQGGGSSWNARARPAMSAACISEPIEFFENATIARW